MITNTQNGDSNMTNFHSKQNPHEKINAEIILFIQLTNLPSPSDMEDPSQVDPGKTKGGGGEGFRKPSPSAFYCYGTIIDRTIVKKDWTSLAISIMTSSFPGPHSPSPRWSPHPIGHRCHRSRSASDNMNMICLTKYFSSPDSLQASRNHRHV